MLPTIDTPTYTMEVPSTKKKVKYRPFLVKEEKVLMHALEGDDDELESALIEATKKIITMCTFGEIKTSTLTDFDIEYLFLNIRSKSRGEEINPTFSCTNEVNGVLCEEENSVKLILDEVKVQFPEEDYNKIVLTDTVGIQFKYISSDILHSHDNSKDEVDKMFKIIVDSIDFIYDETTVYKASETPKKELLDFIDNLTEKNFIKVKSFFENQPLLKHSVEYKCSKCGHTEDIDFVGLHSFFDYA
jgi:hypothetical protein